MPLNEVSRPIRELDLCPHFGGIFVIDSGKAGAITSRSARALEFICSPFDTPKGPDGVIFFCTMPAEPDIKRVVAFIAGQNLFYSAKTAFGYLHPNYDPKTLAMRLCQMRGWKLDQARFYTGFPSADDNAFWNHFWQAKLLQLTREGVHTFSRLLRYRLQTFHLPNGTTHSAVVGQEKGVDVRLAIDVISLAHQRTYDVALVFSQDQDLSEVVGEIRQIAAQQDRWIKMASGFRFSAASPNRRGINGTDWIKIDRATYDARLDSRDYRPKSRS